MKNIRVFHKVDSDFWSLPKSADELKLVHEFAVADITSDEAVAAGCFRRYNAPLEALRSDEIDDALAYRGVKIVDGEAVCDGSGKAIHHEGLAYGIRSLSIGDAVEIDGRLYACASVGWDRLDFGAVA